MKLIISNFRLGRHTKSENNMVIRSDSINSRKEAEKYIGKTLVWISPGKLKKQIKGRVASAHGNTGALRVIFERGMPGQAIGAEVKWLA